MTPPDRAVTAADFDAMYQADADPWDVESSWYERRKLGVLLASLPRERYASAWEPGCGPGLVSQALATRTDRLTASDGSAVAVRLARRRCAGLPQVSVGCSELPASPLTEQVELVVVAEFLYYVPDLKGALETLWSAAAPGAHLAFLHWAHRPHDAHRSGPAMHARIGLDAMRRGARRAVCHLDQDFLLDIYESPA